MPDLIVLFVMKALAITLFILGLFWAYVCLGLVIAPVTFFFEEPNFPGILGATLEFLLCVGLCVNALVGYWVWWGWLTRFRSGAFPHNYLRISLIHHGIWLAAFPLLLASLYDVVLTIKLFKSWLLVVMKMLTEPDAPLIGQVFLGWVVLNMVVCSASVFQAEPAATRSDRTSRSATTT